MASQSYEPLFRVYLVYETNEEERPVEGWKVYDMKPGGRVAIKSKRGRAVKFKRLTDSFEWLKQNRFGYTIQLEGPGYTGELNPTPQKKKTP